MNGRQDEAHGHRDYALERLIMLSDGVFAIAITLLAVDLRPPAHWDGGFESLARDTGRDFKTFLVSFGSVAVYWMLHRRTFGYLRRSDPVFTLLNFLLLGMVTLLPFLAQLMAASGKGLAATVLFLGTIGAMGVVSALQWGWAAFAARLTRPGLPFRFRLYTFLNLLIVPPLMSTLGAFEDTLRAPWLFIVLAATAGALVWLRRRFARDIAEEAIIAGGGAAHHKD